jgi:hypothetical protein
VLSLLLLGLSIGIGNAQTTTTSQPREHVYLLRGFANVFSLGMDQIAAKLQQQGIHATVRQLFGVAKLGRTSRG